MGHNQRSDTTFGVVYFLAGRSMRQKEWHKLDSRKLAEKEQILEQLEKPNLNIN